MPRINIFFKLTGLIFLLQTCNSNQDKTIAHFAKKLGGTDGAHHYLLINGDGCDECVTKLLMFAEQNINNDLICFIVVTANPRYLSASPLKDVKNCVIDNQLISIREGWMNTKPVLYSLDNSNQISKKELRADKLSEDLLFLQKKLKPKPH